jgi:hypothetical protein
MLKTLLQFVLVATMAIVGLVGLFIAWWIAVLPWCWWVRGSPGGAFSRARLPRARVRRARIISPW